MTPDARLLAYSALLCWVMIMTAASLRTRGSIVMGLSNRDAVPEPTPMGARADRAARNMLENLVLFTALVAAARLGDGDRDRIILGARVFFWARVAYFPIYILGVKYIRTTLWGAGVAGMAIVFSAMW
jgi:uncharacterized MAPEG superfamily protein